MTAVCEGSPARVRSARLRAGPHLTTQCPGRGGQAALCGFCTAPGGERLPSRRPLAVEWRQPAGAQ